MPAVSVTARNARLNNAVELGRWGLSGDQIDTLQKLARSLHHAAERWCNEDMDESQEQRLEAMEHTWEARAREVAAQVGLLVYVQSDPRGWPLHLYRGDHKLLTEPQSHRDGKPYTIDSVYNSIGVGVCCE